MNEMETLKRRIRELELNAEEPTTHGHKRVIQIIAGKKIYFCRTSEEEQIFSENNPGVETETFHIELLNSTAEKYLNDPENVKQFTKPEPAESTVSPTQTLEEPESNWRKLAKKLGIPLNKETGGSRKKEDVLMDIVFQTTVPTN